MAQPTRDDGAAPDVAAAARALQRKSAAARSANCHIRELKKLPLSAAQKAELRQLVGGDDG